MKSSEVVGVPSVERKGTRAVPTKPPSASSTGWLAGLRVAVNVSGARAPTQEGESRYTTARVPHRSEQGNLP